MRTSALLSALAATALSAQIRTRQTPGLKPLAADTIKSCDLQIPATEIDDCETVAQKGGLTTAQFLTYNPSVGPDCSKLITGQAYCIHVPDANKPKDSELKTPQPMKGKAVPAGKTYNPPANCRQWQKIFPEDVGNKKKTCEVLAKTWGNTLRENKTEEWLRGLNPGLEVGCTNLEVGAQLCVRVPGATPKSVRRSLPHVVESL